MFFLTPEQTNATRRSFLNGEWAEGIGIATGPMRSRLRRAARTVAGKPKGNDRQYLASSAIPTFSTDILPLFVTGVVDFLAAAGIEQLFSDVDRQISGEFRLAGGSYKACQFGQTNQFLEAEDEHAFHRLYWAARYARAAAFGHSGAAAALPLAWKNWNGATHAVTAFASYTVAERIASLSECLFWMRQSSGGADADVVTSMKGQIWRDAQQLSANIEFGLGIHNHLLNDARGLFRAFRVLADLAEASVWEEQAFRLWNEFFPKLILDDGSFAEQSSHYQLLLCRTALEYFLGARLSHRDLPGGCEAKLSNMFRLANHLLRPDGSLPRFGDNSPDHIVEDLWGLMAAAHHTGLLRTSPRHPAVTPLTLLYCGEAPRLHAMAAPPQESFYPLGGFMFLGSADQSVELAAHGDPRSRAHAHGDSGRGSFELWWRGQIIVREPGSILSSSHPRSAWSRSGLAQNVTCVDGLAPGVTAEDRTFLPSRYAPAGGEWLARHNREVTFRWNGLERIRPGIVLSRNWYFDDADNLSLEERIDGSGGAQFDSRLCLGEGKWELVRRNSDSDPELQWMGPDGSCVTVELNLPPGVNAALTLGWYFPEFGVERQAALLELHGRVTLPVSWAAKWQFRPVAGEILPELSRQCAG